MSEERPCETPQSPVVVQDFAAVGNAHCGTFPKIQGGHCPLSIVMPIDGGKGPRKVGRVPSWAGLKWVMQINQPTSFATAPPTSLDPVWFPFIELFLSHCYISLYLMIFINTFANYSLYSTSFQFVKMPVNHSYQARAGLVWIYLSTDWILQLLHCAQWEQLSVEPAMCFP